MPISVPRCAPREATQSPFVIVCWSSRWRLGKALIDSCMTWRWAAWPGAGASEVSDSTAACVMGSPRIKGFGAGDPRARPPTRDDLPRRAVP